MGPTKAYINHKNLLLNFNLIRNAVKPAKVMCVVKANAYGHGSVEVSRTLINNGVEYLGVAFPEEGVELRNAGIKSPILVFGAQHEDFFEEHIKYDLDFTLTAKHQINPLKNICKQLKKKVRVHIKIDTGMNRVGFLTKNIETILDEIFNEPWFEVVGVYSHLSSSDEIDLTFTYGQIEKFNQFKSYITSKYSMDILFHIANSGAIMRIPESYMDIVRPGVMLYGNPPGPDFNLTWELKEVMTFSSQVTLIKSLGPGEPVSYGRRFYTTESTNIAVVPVGYADGYNRGLTNKGQVLIRGERYPVVGTVCMDQILINLGDKTNVKLGDEVVLFGQQGKNQIRNIEICKQLSTIPYEVTCWVSKRVPRIRTDY